jgi:hypothetical protein
MTTYNAIHVAADGSLQPVRRELTEPAAVHSGCPIPAVPCGTDDASSQPARRRCQEPAPPGPGLSGPGPPRPPG